MAVTALYKICPADGSRNTAGAVECSICGELLRDVQPVAAGPASGVDGPGDRSSPAAGEPTERCECVIPPAGPGLCPTCDRPAGECVEDSDGTAYDFDGAEPHMAGPGSEDGHAEDGGTGPANEAAAASGHGHRTRSAGDAGAFVLAVRGHFQVASSIMLLGRTCDATPPPVEQYLRHQPGVSRRHCLIVGGERDLVVYDLASTNGTFVGNRRVMPESPYRVRWDDLPVSVGLGSGVLCIIEQRS
jgi:hypothetical protein